MSKRSILYTDEPFTFDFGDGEEAPAGRDPEPATSLSTNATKEPPVPQRAAAIPTLEEMDKARAAALPAALQFCSCVIDKRPGEKPTTEPPTAKKGAPSNDDMARFVAAHKASVKKTFQWMEAREQRAAAERATRKRAVRDEDASSDSQDDT